MDFHKAMGLTSFSQKHVKGENNLCKTCLTMKRQLKGTSRVQTSTKQV